MGGAGSRKGKKALNIHMAEMEKTYTATPTKTQPFALSSRMFSSKITNACVCSSLGKSSMK